MFATVAFGASSCKKEGICECTIDGISTSTPVNVTREACNAADDAAKDVGGSCKLK